MTEPNSSVPAPTVRRRKLTPLRVLGCLGAFIVLLVLLALVAPSLASGWAKSKAESTFNETRQGSLRVGELDLAWFSEQHVSDAVVADPEGQPIARVRATLPSLMQLARSGGKHIGAVRVELEADLVADDAGVTNLQRALAPRGTSASPEPEAKPGDEPSLIERLRDLDLDFELVGKRITWSDKETRQLGRPFTISDLKLAAVAKPGAPLAVRGDARIEGTQPGSFALDARWNPSSGTLEGQGELRKFSSALVDGLAAQQGRLAELLGPTFDVVFDARDVTLERGDLSAEIRASATRIALALRLENGVVRARPASGQAGDSGARLLDATIALPRAYLDAFVVPKLPPGSRMDFGASPKPWTVRVDAFEMTLPKTASFDRAALLSMVRGATCRMTAELASPIGFENEETKRAFGRAVSLEGTRVELALAPDAAPSVALTTALVANDRSPISVRASSKDAWDALAKDELPHVDAAVQLEAVPLAALDAFLGTQGRIAEGLGERMNVLVNATDAGLDRGSIELQVNAPRFGVVAPLAVRDGALVGGAEPVRVHLDPPAGWVDRWIQTASAAEDPAAAPSPLSIGAGALALEITELAIPLPAPGAAPASFTKSLRGRASARVLAGLPPLSFAHAASKTTISISNFELGARVTPAGAANVDLRGAILNGGSNGSLACNAAVADVWSAFADDGSIRIPKADVHIEARALPVELAAALSGQGERVRDALGGPLSLDLDARQVDLANGTLSARVQAPRLEVAFEGQLVERVLRTAKDAGLHVVARPEPDFVARQLAAAATPSAELPQVQLASTGDALVLDVVDLEVPLPDFASPAPIQPLAILERARASVRVHAPLVDYADARTRAANVAVALEELVVAAQLAPGQPARMTVDSALLAGGTTTRGTMKLEATLADPWFALRDGNKEMPPVDATLKLADVPTALLDAFSGDAGLVSQLLGPSLALDLTARGASMNGGEISLTSKSTTSELSFQGQLDSGVLSSDKGLALSIRLPAGWLEQQISPKLPAGARLSLPTQDQPLTLNATKLRVPLPIGANAPAGSEKAPSASGSNAGKRDAPAAQGASASTSDVFERLAQLTAEVALVVPELTYADAATDAAQKPIAIRGLHASASFAPQSPPSVKLSATVQGDAPGELAADVTALDPLRTLAEEKGMERFRVACDVRATGLPTALVDALAKQGGLLVEALGARVDVRITSQSLSMSSGTFAADMKSDMHSVRCEGSMEQRVFRIVKQDGLEARIGLGPVTNERVVGRLVPLLVDVAKPEGAAPAIVAVDALSFPFDGGISGLDADVRIDLGQVSANLLPGLDKFLGDAVGLKTLNVPALSIPIRKGVASYKAVPFQVGGQTLSFDGSFDLASLTLRLDTAIPLKLLGKKVNSELERVREYVSPDLAVPIEIRGSWKKPKIEIPSSFVGKLVEEAAKKGVGDLIEDLLKKKKKKD